MEPKTSQVLLAVFTVVTIIGSAALVYNAQSAQQLAAAISGPSTSSSGGGGGLFGLFGGTTNGSSGVNVPGQEPGGAPAAPTSLKLKNVNTNNLELSWVDDGQRNVRYDIYRDDGQGGSLEYLATTYGDWYVDYGLASNKTYTYAVDAVTNSGNFSSKTNNVATTTLTTGSIPAPPTNVKATSDDNSITVSWDQSAGADAYFVYLEYPGQALTDPFRVEGADAHSLVINDLESETNFHVAVAAHDGLGNTSLPSAPVEKQTTGTGGFCVLNSLRGDILKNGSATGLTLWSQAYATSVDIEPGIGKVSNNAAFNVDGPVYSTGNLTKTTTFTATMTLEDGRTLTCNKTITVAGSSGN